MTQLEKDVLTKLRYGLRPTPAEARILSCLAEGWPDLAAFGAHVQDMTTDDFCDLLRSSKERGGA